MVLTLNSERSGALLSRIDEIEHATVRCHSVEQLHGSEQLQKEAQLHGSEHSNDFWLRFKVIECDNKFKEPNQLADRSFSTF